MLTPLDLDPYCYKKNPRLGQMDAIRRAAKALGEGKSAIIRAPTGFGKTFMGLVAVLPLILEENLAFFAARTHSQNRQVLKEAKQYNTHVKRQGLPVQLRVVHLVGKTAACPKMAPPKGGDWESFAQLCKRHREQGHCEFFKKLREYLDTHPPTFGPTGVIDSTEAAEFCQKERLCLYYYLFAHVPGANLLVGSYNYILSPFIRHALLQDGAFQMEDLAIIFDEAHNLPELCRKMASRELARKNLDEARNVLKDRGKFLAQRLKDIQADRDFRRMFPKTWRFLVDKIGTWIIATGALDASVRAFQEEFHQTLTTRLDGLPPYDRDRFATGHEVEVRLEPGVLDHLIPPGDYAHLADASILAGTRRSDVVNKYFEAAYESLWEVLEETKSADEDLAKELPATDAGWADFIVEHQLGGAKLEDFTRTPIHVIVNFMAHRVQYLADDTTSFALITHARREAPTYYTLNLTCFDARVAFAFVRDQSAGLVCMSGSMDRRDLDMLGIPSAPRGMREISDFPVLVPPDHWLVLVDPIDMTDRALKTSNKWKGIATKIAAIAAETPGGVGVFCRNYDHVDKIAGVLGPVVAGKKVFVEEQGGKRKAALLNDYKETARAQGAILVGCTYGKYAEGEDFPGAEMNAAIVVGYPYPPRSPTQLGLARFLESLFPGEGEQVAFDETAVKRVAQVAGRCVRSETDRGLIVLIDQRMGSDQFIQRLPGSLQDVLPVEDFLTIQPRIRKFFAPYLDFLLSLGQDAIQETDLSSKVAKVKKFFNVCKYYFSEKHPPWTRDPKLAGRVREIQQFKRVLRSFIP